jgi:acetyl/propionyl-CoA carboxylase alpha subunit
VLVAAGGKLRYAQADIRQNGHSLECRIYAEVPEENFRPSTGSIEIFEAPMGPGVRLDTGVAQGSKVTHHFDPMLAKLIVWSPGREASIERMKRALDDFVLLGVRNNIDFLHRVISSKDFAEGQLDTDFLPAHSDLLGPPSQIPPAAFVVASLKPHMAPTSHDEFKDVWASGPWRNS